MVVLVVVSLDSPWQKGAFVGLPPVDVFPKLHKRHHHHPYEVKDEQDFQQA